MTHIDKDEQISTTGNRRLAQWRVSWLIEHSTSHQLLWWVDSFVLRNPPLRQAPKRYEQREQTEPQQSKANLWQVTKEKRADGRGTGNCSKLNFRCFNC